MNTQDTQNQGRADGQNVSIKLYWRLYKGAVIREGEHFEGEKGQLLFWHSYEQTEALTVLNDAADEAEKAARG